MEIVVAKNIGFCFGVTRAVNESLKEVDDNTYFLGELVHNKETMKKINGKVVDSIEEIPDKAKVIIRAHGVSKEVLKRANEKLSDAAARRNSIPNLLNQIMSTIPNKVQLTSIQNTSDKNMTIKAQSSDYDQLGYFIAKLKTQKILKNVVSSSGIKSGGIVDVTIEGELP